MSQPLNGGQPTGPMTVHVGLDTVFYLQRLLLQASNKNNKRPLTLKSACKLVVSVNKLRHCVHLKREGKPT